MRLAALYDIHGNLPALEAVLAEVRLAGVDAVVVGGDVLPGPMPRETLDCLSGLEMPVHYIRGNGDRIVLAQRAAGDMSGVPEPYREVIRWTAAQLDPSHERLLAGWPPACRLDIPGRGGVLFCHATPRNDEECFTRVTSEERLHPVFSGVDAPLVVCGHTHMPFDRTIGATRVVNAGSVGMPFCQPPGAYWLLLGPDVQLRRTDYDFASAAERMRATAYPQVQSLSVRYVLQPPTEAESLALFGAVELA